MAGNRFVDGFLGFVRAANLAVAWFPMTMVRFDFLHPPSGSFNVIGTSPGEGNRER